MQWTKEQTDEAAMLKISGLSFRQIGLRFGVTKNAVVGRLSRVMGSIGAIALRRRVPLPSNTELTSLPTFPGETPEHERVSFFDLRDHHCRWVYDDGKFCGKHVCDRGSRKWCASHSRRVYQ